MDQALAILTSLGVNQTFFLMFAVVVVFFFFMNFVALKPLTKVLVERDERIDGRLEKSRVAAEEAQALEANVASSLKDAHRDAAADYAKLKAEALQKQSALLSQAREEAQTKIQQVRQEVASSVSGELAKVSSEIPALAKLVMDRVLLDRSGAKSNKPAMSNPEA
jgi:F-type H+-transporting ATPase subunit b